MGEVGVGIDFSSCGGLLPAFDTVHRWPPSMAVVYNAPFSAAPISAHGAKHQNSENQGKFVYGITVKSALGHEVRTAVRHYDGYRLRM